MPPMGPVEEDDYECIKVYGIKITTNMGVTNIEFRNSSNGHYGGYLVYDLHGDSGPMKEITKDFTAQSNEG